MDRRGGFSISIACLLIAVAVASDAGTSVQETTLRPALGPETWGTNTSSSTVRFVEGAVGRRRPSRSQGEREQVEPRTSENERQHQVVEDDEEDEGPEEDYEGGDEYEDELKAVVESHEAMSRDDTRNSNVSAATATDAAVEAGPTAAKNFDSHEVITVNDSDEDVASNEAITDEHVDKYDQEVAELLKCKKDRNSAHDGSARTKTKRVPTVKKELSTQKEILIGSNETQAVKSLLPSEDASNRPNEATEDDRRRNVGSNESAKLENPGEGEIPVDNRYSEESPRKLDKRQETVLKNLKSYLLTEYATEEEQRQKLRDLGAREDALAENLLKLLVKLAENPSRWEHAQKLLLTTEEEPKRTINSLEPAKRGYDSTLFITATESSTTSRKSRKKLKKKKKKPKHRSTSTLTPVPATPPLPSTTETPWRTTPVQWRLVAERLFGQPWKQDQRPRSQESPNAIYSDARSPRLLTNVRDAIERNRSKSNLGSGASLTEDAGEPDGRRLDRFGKLAARRPGHREFAYERPPDSEHMPDYDVAESYRRLRYDQLPQAPREFPRAREEDYQGDFNAQADGFARNRGYEPSGRNFALSKSWPDVSYEYNPAWGSEQRPQVPISSETWPWRQPRDEAEYWAQRNNLLPVEKSYRLPLANDDDDEDDWQQQQQRLHHSWNRDRSPWPMEKSSKVAPPWQQNERSTKLFLDSNVAWDKGKNRSESNRSTKQDPKGKIVLPEITMKTWNSLTSDPATWPHKLPGAKPWPKDENGKSYNPNADLVRKLGLDKEEAEKSIGESKPKDEKQSRLYASKEKEFPRGAPSEFKPSDRSNFTDFEARSNDSMTPWARLTESKGSKDWVKPESNQADEGNTWRGKYEGKSSWSDETGLPKIQSVGAWVMSAEDSAWKPYRVKPMEMSDDEAFQRWSKPISRSTTDSKWPEKGSWAEKTSDLWPEKNVPDFWKSGKGPWFAKARQTDNRGSKSSEPEPWKTKDGDWLRKADSWASRNGQSGPWTSKGSSWSTRSNESRATKNNDVSKIEEDSWPVKTKEDDSWKMGDAWSRKSNDRSGWSPKSNELSPWQRKISDEWAYGDKAGSTGTWPSKWKQFAYHRVTALPISKPGTTADAASSKSKNAFVAVSAVSSTKYNGNEWKKNDEEGRNENVKLDDRERSNGQPRVGLERPIYAWKKDAALRAGSAKANATDQLENELEALGQIDFWSYEEREAEKRSTTTTGTTSTAPTNATSTTQRRRASGVAAGSSGLLETNRRTISMK
ncbi:uncharacterized protein LOC128893510 [Hylaeus anthracinus]|uniref:uncharacterized protein LOC128893510 n=1 Tax=Hylaeus anthracinus TaxID=313031 RepID=UPI0023B9069E|nr:uncharacterized protein LOC128893510 [Hylaeus anthracinus]